MKELNDILNRQRCYFNKTLVKRKIKDRISKIKQIRQWISEHQQHIIDTCLKDYNKPLPEFYSTEINTVFSHIDFTLKHIKKWTSKKSVWTPIQLIGSRSKIYYEPKGVCLIISPWNYPFNLSLNPLISAIAAGNCVVLKPSEYTPNTSSLIAELIISVFDKDEVIVVEGGADVGSSLIQLKFDHIFFTGSPEIGKMVMAAAANNLTSITLELGGKNHTIVDSTANLKDAAEKIVWSKYVNCGQTCIAVNHVFIHADCYDKFVVCLGEVVEQFFSENSNYTSVVNQKHFERLQGLLNTSLSEGAEVLFSSKSSEKKHHFPLTILKNVKDDNAIVKNEVFGPILPLIKYDDFDSVLEFVNNNEKSLALYLFSKSRSNIDKFLQETSSGTAAINECMLQYANPNLPFGGVNNSGLGKTGGKSGFLAFSHAKSVLFQRSGFSTAKFIYPPYTKFKEKLAKLLR